MTHFLFFPDLIAPRGSLKKSMHYSILARGLAKLKCGGVGNYSPTDDLPSNLYDASLPNKEKGE